VGGCWWVNVVGELVDALLPRCASYRSRCVRASRGGALSRADKHGVAHIRHQKRIEKPSYQASASANNHGGIEKCEMVTAYQRNISMASVAWQHQRGGRRRRTVVALKNGAGGDQTSRIGAWRDGAAAAGTLSSLLLFSLAGMAATSSALANVGEAAWAQTRATVATQSWRHVAPQPTWRLTTIWSSTMAQSSAVSIMNG